MACVPRYALMAALALAALPASVQDLSFNRIVEGLNGRWVQLDEPCAKAIEIRLSPDWRSAEFRNWPAGATTGYLVTKSSTIVGGKKFTSPEITLIKTAGKGGPDLSVLRMPKADMISIKSGLPEKENDPPVILVRCMAGS